MSSDIRVVQLGENIGARIEGYAWAPSMPRPQQRSIRR